MQPINSQTKIIATLGPASSTKEIIHNMIIEGVDVFRLNFSHSTQAEHLKLIHIIQDLNLEFETHVSILADLQGPKLRVGEIENNLINLEENDIVTFVTKKCIGTKDHIFMSYQEFPQDVKAGEAMLIDDGKIKLEVTETNKKNTVKAKVIYGGPLSSNKGVNLPDTKVSLPSLSKEDISNAVFALKHDVDWLGLSFVRKASDIQDLKHIINGQKSEARIIAKIEKPEAVEEIDRIIELADGIMVARGDLGVEVPFDEVPMIQKSIVEKCIMYSKPVIIATQMMESMIANFRPTRAEANDVANAVLDGADALMLSAETSVGNYPVETINSMQRIIDYTENHTNRTNPFEKLHIPVESSPTFLADSICYNASKLAEQVGAKAIISFTHSGYSAIKISSYRPKVKIYAFTNNKKLLQQLSLVWGIKPYHLKIYNQLNAAVIKSVEILKAEKLLKDGDCVVFVGSTPLSEHGSTNMLKVSLI
ncbi:MAG: pyruvate kinase [Paludibacter sp.]|nr:pyruvate kinase [Paludibacter sp.]